MKFQFTLFLVFLLLLNCALAQPRDTSYAIIQSSYPLCIKKNNTNDSAAQIYRIKQYCYDSLGKRTLYHFALEASPKLFIPAPTNKHVSIRFKIPINHNKSDELVISRNKNDSMIIKISNAEFYTYKGFIDTISFVPGIFKLSEVKEIKKNRDEFYSKISSDRYNSYCPNCMFEGYGPSSYHFISDTTVVYANNFDLYAISNPNMPYEREKNKSTSDTISYRISRDTLYLIKPLPEEFLSSKEAWIRYRPYIFYVYKWNISKKRWHGQRVWESKQYQKKIQKQNDTLNFKVFIEPLLLENSKNSKIEIYINDSLCYKGNDIQEYNTEIIRKHKDSLEVKVKFEYTCNGKNFTLENTFLVKNYGYITVPVGVSYKQEFFFHHPDYLIIRNNMLYARARKSSNASNDFYLRNGIPLNESGFKRQ